MSIAISTPGTQRVNYTKEMETYHDKIIDVIQFVVDSYDSITQQDIVETLRHRADEYESHGRPTIYTGSGTDDDATRSNQSVTREMHEQGEFTPNRLFNICLGARTSTVYRLSITDDQVSTVMRHAAAYVEQNGLNAVQ